MPARDDIMRDYVPVNERIGAFLAKHPEGSLQSELVELSDTRVVMRAYAYRTPTDERPGIGFSSLEIPGRTPYTRGSEVENCETSAWGRAIAALGFEVKRGIASREEVANKADDRPFPGIVETREHPVNLPSDGSGDRHNGAEREEMMGRATRRGIIRRGSAELFKLDIREGPAGRTIGFRLEIAEEKAIPQCVVSGPLCEALLLAYPDPTKLLGTAATISGLLYNVRRADKPGSWYRLHVDRFENADWIFPADEPVLPAPPADVPLLGEAEATTEELGLLV
jgi:hypothetical protein